MWMTPSRPWRGAISELLDRVDAAKRARTIAVSELLGHVARQLVAIREKERELDRREARRFNVFRYLQTGELGLSRMIADLLDPTADADHGQGSLFLNAMLDILSDTGEKTRALLGSLRATAVNRARVTTERWIPSDGYIDITVDVPSANGPFCLAFENKPYAPDGDRQLSRYLEYLDKQYPGRFLLVYVPPRKREPDPTALPPEDREYWRGRGQFRVIPYIGAKASIKNWFADCRKRCTAKRLRLCLGDAQSFCRERFGGFTMTADSETHFIRKLLSKNPGQMHAALAVHDAWPAIRTEVCRRFLRHLHRKVEEGLRKELPETAGLRVRWHYSSHKPNRIRLWIARDNWVRSVPAGPIKDGCTMIMLHNSGKAPNGWRWGVRNPNPTGEMTEAEKERVEALEAALRPVVSRSRGAATTGGHSGKVCSAITIGTRLHPTSPTNARRGAERSRITTWTACSALPSLRFR